jgi:hypothetical protein
MARLIRPGAPLHGQDMRLDRAVTYEEWLDDMHLYLLRVFESIQDQNRRSGMRVLDASTCEFSSFCEFAYGHSTLYTYRDRWAYVDDENSERSNEENNEELIE